jgi:hypothetical protein
VITVSRMSRWYCLIKKSKKTPPQRRLLSSQQPVDFSPLSDRKVQRHLLVEPDMFSLHWHVSKTSCHFCGFWKTLCLKKSGRCTVLKVIHTRQNARELCNKLCIFQKMPEIRKKDWACTLRTAILYVIRNTGKEARRKNPVLESCYSGNNYNNNIVRRVSRNWLKNKGTFYRRRNYQLTHKYW